MTEFRTQGCRLASAAVSVAALLMAGCMDNVKGNKEIEAQKPPAVAPATASVPLKPDADPGSAVADADARVQLAVICRNAVGKREEQLAAVLVRLKRALDGIDRSVDGARLETASAEFHKVVKLQRRAAADVAAGYVEFRKATDGYRRNLDRAPEAYRQAALYYRERGAAAGNDLLRANYVKLGDMADAYGRLIRARQVELEGFVAAAAETVRYVEGLAAFLKDFDEFFQLSPGAEATAVRVQFRDQLKGFAQSYAATQSQKLFQKGEGS